AQYHYLRALEDHADTSLVLYNMGNVIYGAGEYEKSSQLFGAALDSNSSLERQSQTLYNLGTSELQAQKPDRAIPAYIEALRRNPDDLDAKQNLELALRMRQQQQQQQQQEQQNQGEQKQDSTQQQNGQQKQQDQDQQQQEQQQQNQDQQQGEENQQQPQKQQGQPQQMTKEEAEQLLNALLQDEQNTLEQVRKMKATARKKRERDW
ncbi:hypothetical protein IT157_07405, partial [bacterium]|nr:hypothetical protein [bacterium]